MQQNPILIADSGRRLGKNPQACPLPLPGLPRFPGAGLPEPESDRRRFYIRSVAMLALSVTAIYLTWRALYTVDLDVWWISIPLIIVEIHAFLSLALFTHSLWDLDAVPDAGIVDETQDRVAVLIPTYNEGEEVLLPVIAAAVALEPAHETWVLDDGRRPEVRSLAESLGAQYLTRPDNAHAKAGNINHALEHIDADLIAILDADHIPTPNFLRHTLGYFEDPDIAIVQTPQDFYNTDSFEHDDVTEEVREHERQLYHEQAMFYRVIQPGKNRVGGAFWCGTGAVVRVAALREAGGIATETITEDIHTTIRLHRLGWKTVYHNEVLARGLAAANAEQYRIQRLRWGTGAMQVLRTENPLFVSNLSLGQRLSYAATLLGWFEAWRTLAYILIPPLVLFTGAVPIRAYPVTFFVAFSVTFLLQRWALRLLGRGYYREKMQLVFEAVRMTPNLLATLSLVRLRGHRFQVTPKGRTGYQRERIRPSRLLWVLLGLSGAACAWYVLTVAGLTPLDYQIPWAAHGAAFWLLVNGVIVSLAIRRVLMARYGAERRASVRLATGLHGTFNGHWCRIENVSLTGARIVVSGSHRIHDPSRLEVRLGGNTIGLDVAIRTEEPDPDAGQTLYGVEFEPGQISERSTLALALFNPQATLTVLARLPDRAAA